MKVAIFSKSDAAGGGAGRIAQGLRQWLADDDHQVVHFARWGGEPFHGSFQPAYGRGVRLAKRLEEKALMNEALPLELGAILQRLHRFRPDVVHFHDLTTAYNVRTVHAVARRYPTVWTMHDQSPMTGGCITAHPCERFKVGCGQCPRFPSWSMHGRKDLTARVLRQKQRFFESGRAELTAPSRAAVDSLLTSGVVRRRHDIEVVPNGLDMRAIRAIDPLTARRWLGLPADRFIILVVALDLDDPLKNPPSQREALRAVSDLDPLIVVMGNTSGNPGVAFSPNDVKNMGFVASEPLKNVVYSAADLFLNTSLGDTFSLTTLESLASATPVVAYASGGIRELIVDGETGVLVTPDDAIELTTVLRSLMTSGPPATWRPAARARAESFSHRRVVEGYLRAYERAAHRFAS